MKEPPSAETLALFAHGSLSVDELLEVDEHLAGCAACRSAAGGTMQTPVERRWGEALEGETSEHVSYEELVRHVDGELSEEERTVIADHFEECSMCRDEQLDLHELRAQLNPRPPRTWRSRRRRWLASAAAAAAVVLFLFAVMKSRQAAPNAEPLAPVVAQTKPIVEPKPSAPQPVIRDGDRVYSVVHGRIEGLAPSEQKIVDTLMRGAQPAAALLGVLNPSVGSLRGESKSSEVLLGEPVGSVIEEDRPTFRWQSRVSGSRFVIEVYDERFRLVATSDERTATEWRPSEPLRRGQTYSWQVIRLGSGREVFPKPPLALSRFKVISVDAARELRDARTKESRLELALLYAREGMTESASRELQRLSDENPDVSILREMLEGTGSASLTARPRTR